MAHYLVTGAAGFIGARVVDMLLDDGHSVLGVDNMNDAYDVRMKEYRLARLQNRQGFGFRRLDVGDKDAVASLDDVAPAFDAVLNLAARAGVRASLIDPWTYVDTNMVGTLNLLELCRRKGIGKIVLASTSSIYGQDAPLPTSEAAGSSRPLQAYAASKKGAEAMCHAYHFLFGVDVTIYRYFTVYGPAGRPDMVMFRFAKWIAEDQPVLLNGDGEQSRGFTYVDDIARGTIAGLRPLGYEIINLGGHESITINELIRLLEQFIGKKANVERRPFHRADMKANLADVSKARALLEWEPRVPLAEGVRQTVEWYLANREWAAGISTE